MTVGAVLLSAPVLPAAAQSAAPALRAAAHTSLKASSPQDGGRVGTAPSHLVLEFTGRLVTFGYRVEVRGPDGRAYQAGPPRVVRATLTQPMMPLGPPGEYQVAFRVVAADGHPLAGGIRFTLTVPGPAAGGVMAVEAPAPLALVPPASLADSVNNAPAWASWLAGVLSLAMVLGTALLGRRMTRDLD
ncbi:copper resistance CopC family protein [Nonomuraea insulae]|uniref:copper resistance CopC family protein n=1 Tax=Nonomuraea insulae TaxID=1616787 RepID=UPI0036D2A9D1